MLIVGLATKLVISIGINSGNNAGGRRFQCSRHELFLAHRPGDSLSGWDPRFVPDHAEQSVRAAVRAGWQLARRFGGSWSSGVLNRCSSC